MRYKPGGTGFPGGSLGICAETASGDELKEAIETAHRGGCYLSRSSLRPGHSSRGGRPPACLGQGSQLTKRQREVLQLVAEGKTMKEVATQLNISTRTAESYKYNLMNVLGIRTTAELVQHAIKSIDHGQTARGTV